MLCLSIHEEIIEIIDTQQKQDDVTVLRFIQSSSIYQSVQLSSHRSLIYRENFFVFCDQWQNLQCTLNFITLFLVVIDNNVIPLLYNVNRILELMNTMTLFYIETIFRFLMYILYDPKNKKKLCTYEFRLPMMTVSRPRSSTTLRQLFGSESFASEWSRCSRIL